jgi:hypothetical protein
MTLIREATTRAIPCVVEVTVAASEEWRSTPPSGAGARRGR